MKKEVTVFKIQRPIFQTGNLAVLCYNKDKSIIGEFPPTQELLNMFKKDELKIYVFGYYDNKTKKVMIIKKATHRNWLNN